MARGRQAAWAVKLLMRENPPGSLWIEDRARIDPTQLELDVAIGELSREVSRGVPAERLSAVRALSWLGDRRAISPLVRGSQDPEWDVRIVAVEGLGQFPPLLEWALTPLQCRLDDSEPAVRAVAARSMACL
jgi:HEAT repeat protein